MTIIINVVTYPAVEVIILIRQQDRMYIVIVPTSTAHCPLIDLVTTLHCCENCMVLDHEYIQYSYAKYRYRKSHKGATLAKSLSVRQMCKKLNLVQN